MLVLHTTNQYARILRIHMVPEHFHMWSLSAQPVHLKFSESGPKTK